MNSRSKWFLVCAGALAGGWLIGYGMGGRSVPSAADANGGKSPSALAAAPIGGQSQESTIAPEDEARQAVQKLLGALRDPDYMRRTRDLYDTVLKMTPEAIVSAISIVNRLPQTEKHELLHYLTKRWAESDPRAALKFARSLSGRSQYSTVPAVLNAWAETDMNAAREWARSLPPGWERTQALQGLIGRMAREDPASALALVKAYPAEYSTYNAYEILFRAWTARNPKVAAEQALALPQRRNRDEAFRSVINGWAEADPQAALAWAGGIQEPGVRSEALQVAYRWWAAQDPKAATASVLALPAGKDRDRALGTIVESLGNSDPQAAYALIAEMPAGSARDEATVTLVRSWVRNDLPAAMAWVAELPEGKTKENAQESVLFQLSRFDTPAAAKYAMANYMVSAEEMVRHWAQADPRSAADFVMKEGRSGGNLVRAVAAGWAGADLQQALAWTRQLADDAARDGALRAIIDCIARSDPAQAASLFFELPVPNGTFMSAMTGPSISRHVALQWAERDFDAVAAWVVQLPQGADKLDAIDGLVAATKDLAKTAGWLDKLAPGPSRDAAICRLSAMAAATDPAGAAAWAASISNAGLRNSTVERFAGQWLQRDKGAATQWITQSTALDAATKQRLLRGN